MRQISLTSLKAMLAESSTLVPVILLKIEHPSAVTSYFCNNNENVTHLGQEYQWYPFKITLPQSSKNDEMIEVQVTIGNIDQSIVAMLRGMQTAPTITITVIYVNSETRESDDAEYGPIELKYKRQDITPKTITGTLSYNEDFLNQAFLTETFNPHTARGMFK